MDSNIILARAFYYDFFASALFFYEKSEKFDLFMDKIAVLSQNPIGENDGENFKILLNFDFESFKSEQNSVLFDFSYANVPTTASFYKEGRDEGEMKILVSNVLKRSKFRKNEKVCKDSEDFLGFIFSFNSTLLRNDEISLSNELFSSVINEFVDEFCEILSSHKSAKFFKAYAEILQNFIALERSLLAIKPPQIRQSAAKIAMNQTPYKSAFKAPKEIFDFDENAEK